MSYRTGFEILETADMSSKRVYRSMECNKNSILTQIVTGIILHNPSSFTGLVMRVYSDNGGSPGSLIATSTNSWSKTQLLLTHNYGVKWVYFNFNNVNLRQGLTYHYILEGASSYTADTDTSAGNSYIGWRIDYPEGIYDDIVYEDQIKWYFDLAFLGKRL